MFNKGRLHNQHIIKIIVSGIFLNRNNNSIKQDTLYIADIDTNTNIKTEFIKRGLLVSKIRKYFYQKDKIIMTEDDFESYSTKTIISKTGNIESKHITDSNDSIIKSFYYNYDNKNRLVNCQEHFQTKYFYNDRDSILKKVKIYNSFEGISDSITINYLYDSQNRLVELAQTESKTFCRTFPLRCDGERLHYREFYSYDTCCSMLKEDKNCEDCSYIYYFNWGFIKNRYNNSELTQSIYTRLMKNNTLKESYHDRIRIVTYEEDCDDIIKENCLPIRIEFMDKDNYMNYSIIYEK